MTPCPILQALAAVPEGERCQHKPWTQAIADAKFNTALPTTHCCPLPTMHYQVPTAECPVPTCCRPPPAPRPECAAGCLLPVCVSLAACRLLRGLTTAGGVRGRAVSCPHFCAPPYSGPSHPRVSSRFAVAFTAKCTPFAPHLRLPLRKHRKRRKL